MLANAGHPGGAVHELIDAANRAGGKDNVTVLVVEGEQFAAAREMPGDGRAARREACSPAGRRCSFTAWCARRWSLPACVISGWLDQPPEVPAAADAQGGNRRFRQHRRSDGARRGPAIPWKCRPANIRSNFGSGTACTVRGRLPDVPILRAAPNQNGPAVAIVAEGVHGARVSGFRIRADEKAPLAYGSA